MSHSECSESIVVRADFSTSEILHENYYQERHIDISDSVSYQGYVFK